ncbi:MAG TPA: CARDB domain-containing protein, partial [Lacipirellulaceae bacterium]|nr:CARDB domain-containing protein [Lacipirellulaceae bacterium]
EFSVRLALPGSAPAGYSHEGPFYVGMVTDYLDTVSETDEGNNSPPAGGLHVSYDSFTLPPTIDLRGLSCLAPTTIDWGETFDVLGQVHNAGRLAATTDFLQQFFLSPDAVWGDGDEIFLGQYMHKADVPALGVGPSFLASLTMPSAPPAGFGGGGPFYLGMTTDAFNQVPEENETNNYPGAIGLGFDYDSFVLPAYADMLGAVVSVPAAIGWGQSFTVTAQVRNAGTANVTTDFRQQFFLGADLVWGNGEERFLGDFLHVSDVAASGVGASFQATLTLPATPPAGFVGNGPFYIGMTTDALNAVAEKIETNNFPGSAGLLFDFDRFTLLSNDSFAHRVNLGSAKSTADGGNNQGYSSEPGEPSVDFRIEPVTSAWWTWTAPADGTLTVDTFGSNFDTWLSVWTGGAVNALSLVAQNDDDGGAQSRIVAGVSAGTQYQIAVDGYGAATGSIALNLSLANNDDFAFRTDVGSASSVATTGSNRGFSSQSGEPQQSGAIHSAWWTWTAPSTGILTVDTLGSNFDTYLTLATGSAVDNLVVLEQNDDSVGLQSRISRVVAAGTPYQIAVDGYQGATGDVSLHMSFVNNDSFANRIDLGSATTATQIGGNVGYTGQHLEPLQSGLLNSAWWAWTAPADGILTVDTAGSSFDTYLTLTSGSTIDNLRIEAQNDDALGLQSRVQRVVTAGKQYQIAVDGYQNATGQIGLNLAFSPGVPNLQPNQPAGWSGPLVVTRTTGTTVDDAGLLSTEPLYVDWSILNVGTAATSGATTARLYVDDVLRAVTVVPQLSAGIGSRELDLPLGPLSTGIHTLTLVVDEENLVLESSNGDNSYQRIVTIGEGLGSIRVVLDAVPNSGLEFHYTSTLGGLVLDDDADQQFSNQGMFAGVPPGAHALIQDSSPLWTLSGVAISGDQDGGSVVSLATRTVTVDVDPGENISLVFINNWTWTPGDYDYDGDVDGDDLTVWRGAFGSPATTTGDGDGDHDADGADFLIWQRNLGAGGGAGASRAEAAGESAFDPPHAAKLPYGLDLARPLIAATSWQARDAALADFARTAGWFASGTRSAAEIWAVDADRIHWSWKTIAAAIRRVEMINPRSFDSEAAPLSRRSANGQFASEGPFLFMERRLTSERL